MDASGGSGIRSGLRVRAGCALALVAISAACAPSVAGASRAKKPRPPATATHLALGDSLAFGYSQQLYNEGAAKGYDNPEGFENGYADQYLGLTKGEAAGVRLQNDGCPGETSASLIGVGLAKTLNTTAGLKTPVPVTGEAPCAYQEAWNAFKKVGAGGPLHHGYVGKSQLEDAITTIATKAKLEHIPVMTVSLDIGANDQLHAVKGVEKEIEAKVKKIAEGLVKKEIVEPIVFKELEEKVIKPAVEKEIQEKIIEPFVTKELQEKYIGPAVGEKCFIKTGGTEPAMKECLEKEGKKLGEEWAFEHKAELEVKGKEIAGEYEVAHKAELEATAKKLGFEYFVKHGEELATKGEELGLEYFKEHEAELIKDGEALGHKYAFEHHAELVAEAEVKIEEKSKALGEQINSNIAAILYALRHGSEFGGVDYGGKVIFLGTYNPYGKLFRSKAEADTFVAEHGGLTGPFAELDTGGAVHPKFNALLAALTASEAATVGAFGGCTTTPEHVFNNGKKSEASHLQKLINMTNGSKTGGAYNGPDIHPTPAGYKQLAKEMTKC
jgi:lysophospholipase L1-like esterase